MQAYKFETMVQENGEYLAYPPTQRARSNPYADIAGIAAIRSSRSIAWRRVACPSSSPTVDRGKNSYHALKRARSRSTSTARPGR